jgi:hypothetical protein
LPQTAVLQISASQVARLIGVSHRHWALALFLFLFCGKEKIAGKKHKETIWLLCCGFVVLDF